MAAFRRATRVRSSIRARMLVALVPLIACGEPFLPQTPDPQQTLEGPLDGLSASQAAAHARGDGEFARSFTAATGLGPIFVATSCASCHVGDGKGHPVVDITRFGRRTATGFDPLESLGGPQLQSRAIQGHVGETVPTAANAVARFMAPALSGLGLLEAVDDETILALADPEDRNGDGISGRASFVDSTDLIARFTSLQALVAGDPRTRHVVRNGQYLGRFGRKARAINLLHQTAFAYSQDMGITSSFVPRDVPNLQVGAEASDGAADPEVSSSVVDAVVFYLRTLRAPPRRGASAGDVLAGESAFRDIGCARCHVPAMTTGVSEIAALSRVELHPFSDLLLHDMGPELDDGYTEGDALSSEWRTTPLWGIGLAERSQGGTPFYLHDGRARTLRDAIRFHGGEGARSRSAFDALPRAQQEQVLAYLRSL